MRRASQIWLPVCGDAIVATLSDVSIRQPQHLMSAMLVAIALLRGNLRIIAAESISGEVAAPLLQPASIKVGLHLTDGFVSTSDWLLWLGFADST